MKKLLLIVLLALAGPAVASQPVESPDFSDWVFLDHTPSYTTQSRVPANGVVDG